MGYILVDVGDFGIQTLPVDPKEIKVDGSDSLYEFALYFVHELMESNQVDFLEDLQEEIACYLAK